MFHVSNAAAPFGSRTMHKFKSLGDAVAYATSLEIPAMWDTTKGGSWVQHPINENFLEILKNACDKAGIN